MSSYLLHLSHSCATWKSANALKKTVQEIWTQHISLLSRLFALKSWLPGLLYNGSDIYVSLPSCQLHEEGEVLTSSRNFSPHLDLAAALRNRPQALGCAKVSCCLWVCQRLSPGAPHFLTDQCSGGLHCWPSQHKLPEHLK